MLLSLHGSRLHASGEVFLPLERRRGAMKTNLNWRQMAQGKRGMAGPKTAAGGGVSRPASQVSKKGTKDPGYTGAGKGVNIGSMSGGVGRKRG